MHGQAQRREPGKAAAVQQQVGNVCTCTTSMQLQAKDQACGTQCTIVCKEWKVKGSGWA